MSKSNIVLDLDQTLISAEPTEDYDFEKNSEKSKLFKYKNMDGYYIVFERPGLQKFLDYLFNNFNVCIWTAASKDYALYIIEHIILQKPGRKLDWIFFSYHCNISKKLTGNSKDLKVIFDTFKLPGYNKDNTIILDDYDEVFKTQPTMCVAAIPFEYTDKGSEKDRYMHDLMKSMKSVKNFTSIQIQEHLDRK
jgi:TFIIF-interacting CTD phosphatase-like protein